MKPPVFPSSDVPALGRSGRRQIRVVSPVRDGLSSSRRLPPLLLRASQKIGRPRLSRAEIIRKAQQFLERYAGEAVKVLSLAVAAEVSNRTLHNAFMEEYGVSPKRFLHLRLLDAARRELVRCDPRFTRVTEVASRLGIWEWGRFARDYRVIYGELPSETLRRRSVDALRV